MESIRKSMPDLVLTDVMMPEMDGNELCRCIKNDNDLKQLPVIILTASRMRTRSRAVSAGRTTI